MLKGITPFTTATPQPHLGDTQLGIKVGYTFPDSAAHKRVQLAVRVCRAVWPPANRRDGANRFRQTLSPRDHCATRSICQDGAETTALSGVIWLFITRQHRGCRRTYDNFVNEVAPPPISINSAAPTFKGGGGEDLGQTQVLF